MTLTKYKAMVKVITSNWLHVIVSSLWGKVLEGQQLCTDCLSREFTLVAFSFVKFNGGVVYYIQLKS